MMFYNLAAVKGCADRVEILVVVSLMEYCPKDIEKLTL